jgi:hypothetical protein
MMAELSTQRQVAIKYMLLYCTELMSSRLLAGVNILLVFMLHVSSSLYHNWLNQVHETSTEHVATLC